MNMIEFSKLYNSIALPIAGFIFTLYIIVIYYSGEKYNSFSNKTYRWLLSITLLSAGSFILFCFSADGVFLFNLKPIFARLYVLFMMLWGSIFAYYLIITFIMKDQVQKKVRMWKILVLVYTIILYIISCFNNLEYNNGTLYAMGGDCLKYLYVELVFAIVVMIITIFTMKKRSTKSQFVTYVSSLVVAFLLMGLLFLFDIDINCFTFIVCIFPISLYFISESQTYLLEKKLEQVIIKANEEERIQYSLFKDTSKKIREPIDNIYAFNENIRSNMKDVNYINGEKEKICKEYNNIFTILGNLSKDKSENGGEK